jgi:hypothetical protein
VSAAKRTSPAAETETERLRAMWEAFGRDHERRRPEREARWSSKSAAELLALRIEESRGDLDLVTTACLGVAVPMWIDRMRHWLPREREQRAQALVEIVAHHQAIAALCDAEARGTARRGDIGVAFNAVAEGLALLAYCPGGIVFGGHHWEAARG